MAVFGPLSTVRAQLAHDTRFAAAFAYVAEVLQPSSAVRRRLEEIAELHVKEIKGSTVRVRFCKRCNEEIDR